MLATVSVPPAVLLMDSLTTLNQFPDVIELRYYK